MNGPKPLQVCLFASESDGAERVFGTAATELGRALGAGGHTLIFGGASTGLAGSVADATLAFGGDVTAFVDQPRPDDDGADLTNLVVADSAEDARRRMLGTGDAAVAMPGGLAPLSELLEAASGGWADHHQLRIGLLNVNGFFEPLLQLLDRALVDRFLEPLERERFLVDVDPQRLLGRLAESSPHRASTTVATDDSPATS